MTKNELDQTNCQKGDFRLLGQALADAMLEYRVNQTRGQDSRPDFALINAGGVRATIDAGNITRGEVLTSFPFGNAVVELKYKGSDLRKILEGCVSKVNQFNQKKLSSWFQVSDGIVIEYNPKNEAGSTLVNFTTVDGHSRSPTNKTTASSRSTSSPAAATISSRAPRTSSASTRWPRCSSPTSRRGARWATSCRSGSWPLSPAAAAAAVATGPAVVVAREATARTALLGALAVPVWGAVLSVVFIVAAAIAV